MQNRPTNLFASISPKDSRSAWEVDAAPHRRLRCLLMAMTLPVVAVCGRLAYLQIALPDRFTYAANQTTVQWETIPSSDGRVLSADGRVLAEDVQQFELLVHYRWLEEPADPNWLRQQALARLSPRDRRDKKRIRSAEQEVLAEREATWHRLADVTGREPDEIHNNRRRVQNRVERIVSCVESARRKSDADRLELYGSAELADGTSKTKRIWHSVVRTLTTSPSRLEEDPIIVREELDYHPILDRLNMTQAVHIESHRELFPGTQIAISTRRVYPQRQSAAHIVGTRRKITPEELAKRKQQYPQGDPFDYHDGDRIGQTGIERSYDRSLHGERGRRRITRNHRGEVIETEIIAEPIRGRDVTLTLRIDLQQRAEALLDESMSAHEEKAGGAIIVMDVYTGAILAAASAPRFDAQELVQPDAETWQALMDDRRMPLFHRATQMALPPGSVFKVLSAVAVLESGRFDPETPILCQGFLDRPDRHRCYIYRHYGVGHGEMNLTDALARSCNVYFFTAARQVGFEPIVTWAYRLGFGQRTGIDLPGETEGHVPNPRSADERWYPGDTLGLAIGQSRLLVTPVQIVRLMAAIANGGELVTPHLVQSISASAAEDQSGPILHETYPIPDLSPSTLARVRSGLEQVVAHPRGTGYKTVRHPQVTIAGKTGTAEVGIGQTDHAWFAGYVPADRPRYAFVVVLEHGGSGGRDAGPVARNLVDALLETGLIEPRRSTKSKVVDSN